MFRQLNQIKSYLDCLDLLTGKNYQNYDYPDRVLAVKRSQGYKPKTLISINLSLLNELKRRLER